MTQMMPQTCSRHAPDDSTDGLDGLFSHIENWSYGDLNISTSSSDDDDDDDNVDDDNDDDDDDDGCDLNGGVRCGSDLRENTVGAKSRDETEWPSEGGCWKCYFGNQRNGVFEIWKMLVFPKSWNNYLLTHLSAPFELLLRRLVTFETFDQIDEETWPDQKIEKRIFKSIFVGSVPGSCIFWSVWVYLAWNSF